MKPKPELQTFNTCDSNGKYCDRSMLNIGSFNALSVGMTAEEVTGKLQKNAESSSWATVDGKEAVRYEYSASITSVTVNYIDGKLYSAIHSIYDPRSKVVKVTDLNNDGSFTQHE